MYDPARTTFERILTSGEKAALRGAVFANREFVGIDLSGADLRGARFDRTRLARCNLSRADLRGAHFNLCDLDEVVLADTLFGDNRFDGTSIVGAVGLSPPTRTLIEQWGAAVQPAHASHR